MADMKGLAIAKQNLPAELVSFQETKIEHPEQASLIQANLELFAIKNADFAWRVKRRGRYGGWIMAILIGQNVFVFGLIAFILA